MTQTLSVNENNDIFIGRDGNLVVVYGLEAVLQACAHAVKTRFGEMVLQTDQGVPYFELVWNGVPNLQQFDAVLRQVLLNVADVQEIVSLVITQNGDILNYVATIRTIYGTGDING